MPKRRDIHSILVIGSGPIVIGQASEFDYAGTQACLSLQEEGYKVILVNSNPATIMTDPKTADVVYIEPITEDSIRHIIEKERPDAILSTMGGQTALNIALSLEKSGILSYFGVELIGAQSKTIALTEDRILFRNMIEQLNLNIPKSVQVKDLSEVKDALLSIDLPIIIRSSFSLGGDRSGIAYTEEEVIGLCERAFHMHRTLHLDEALFGWKEFEMEVIRDKNDNCIVVCSIENIDPLGIHTGDSITVCPTQTLTDKEYQKMRNASLMIVRAVGIETGGANIQFAVHPQNGKMVVIEMNPRVSRSSALASKATGFPIAKIAAKLAIGYTLPELTASKIGHKIPASFEPALDYVVVKIPRFHFEKFTKTPPILSTQMQSVGEAMAIGRTFQEALLKAMRSIDANLPEKILDLQPGPFRLWAIFDAIRKGKSIIEIQKTTHIDLWFLQQIADLISEEMNCLGKGIQTFSKEELHHYKQLGFSDLHLSHLFGCLEKDVLAARQRLQIFPVYKRVDSCAGEIDSSLPCLYSCYEEECESFPSSKPKVIIIGSGPCRIGQGIEFDYCTVHAISTLKELGFETITINCNPETVSTDTDLSDKLYISPLTVEDVFEIAAIEKPIGILAQYGGQTSLQLGLELEKLGISLLGISSKIIQQTEDRSTFRDFICKIGLKQPLNWAVNSVEEGLNAGEYIGYPLILRPSFVLGGNGISFASNRRELESQLHDVLRNAPILIEQFLNGAIEVDIDAICDGTEIFVPAIMEQIEPAGIHSGDSACCIPPFRLSPSIQQKLIQQTKQIALGLNLIGLINIQFAIQGETIYVIEANPRASRTCPFSSKATGIDIIAIAVRCIMGHSLETQNIQKNALSPYFAIKEAVLPFSKFMLENPVLGPQMKATGEVMSIGRSFAESYRKAQIASGHSWPKKNSLGVVSFSSLPDHWIQKLNKEIKNSWLQWHTLPSQDLLLPSIDIEEIAKKTKEGCIGFIIAIGTEPYLDILRQTAVRNNILYATTIEAAIYLLQALIEEDENLIFRLPCQSPFTFLL